MTLDVTELARAVRMSLLYPGFCFEWIPALDRFVVTPPENAPGDADLFADQITLTHAATARSRRWPAEKLVACGSHGAYNRHKRRREHVDRACLIAERDYQRDKARRRRAHAQLHPQSSPQAVYPPVLTTPSGAPMLISVAGQRESGAQGTAEEPASRRGETVPGTPDADAVTESEAS